VAYHPLPWNFGGASDLSNPALGLPVCLHVAGMVVSRYEDLDNQNRLSCSLMREIGDKKIGHPFSK